MPFSDFEEIQNYLKQQWASMLYRFLTTEGEARRTADILEALGRANERIELLARSVVESVGDPMTKATVALYDILLNHEVIQDFQMWHIPVFPKAILDKKTIDEFCGGRIEVVPEYEGFTISGGGPPYKLSKDKYEADAEEYQLLRARLLETLGKRQISVPDYVASAQN
jgi:hypothetical protein